MKSQNLQKMSKKCAFRAQDMRTQLGCVSWAALWSKPRPVAARQMDLEIRKGLSTGQIAPINA